MSKIEIKSYNRSFFVDDVFCKKVETIEYERLGTIEKRSEYKIIIVDKLGNEMHGMNFISFENKDEKQFTKEQLVKLLNEHYETYDLVSQLTYYNVDSFYIEGELHDIAIDEYKKDVARLKREKDWLDGKIYIKDEKKEKEKARLDKYIIEYSKRIEFLENN